MFTESPMFPLDMDRELTPEQTADFKECLGKWYFPIDHYQVLEAIFRQCMMAHSETGYKYNHDKIDPNLTGRFDPKVRHDRLKAYIQTRFLNSSGVYGFQAVEMNELSDLQKALTDYDSLKTFLNDLSNENQILLDSSLRDIVLKKIQKRIVEQTKINNRTNKRLISFNAANEPVLTVALHDYFLRYLELSIAVFYPYFETIRKRSDEDGRGNNIYRFLSKKIRKEHGHILSENETEPYRLKERIDNNRKGHHKWASIPSELYPFTERE